VTARRVLSVFTVSFLLGAALAPRAQAHPAWGIVIDSEGRVVFSDVGSNAIWRVERDGRLTAVARSVHSHDLWLDGEGRLRGRHDYWVAGENRFDGYFFRIAANGTLTRLESSAPQEPAPGEHPGSFTDGDGVTYRPDTDTRAVWRVTPGGERQRVYTSPRFWIPVGVVVSKGVLFVLEARPNGLPQLLGLWEDPRVMRVPPGGPPVLLMSIDFNRPWVVLGAAALLASPAAAAVLWVRRRGTRR
jgi:hypothetical protein